MDDEPRRFIVAQRSDVEMPAGSAKAFDRLEPTLPE